MSRRPFLSLAGLFVLAGLGCGVIGFAADPAPLTGPAYWAAQTATPVPTVTVFLGTSTPVYADTPVPGFQTTTPFWTTVTATPAVPPATPTPAGFTATPFWVTTTPGFITETPEPPVTTTPGLPLIGFTTPVPTETPYYRIGSFYMHSDVTIGGPRGLVLRVTAHETQPSPRQAAAVYHYVTVRVTNYSAAPQIVPVSDVIFARRVQPGTGQLYGRWVPQTEPLRARGLADYTAQQAAPIPAGGTREVVLGFVLPEGEVPELGLITHWQRPLEGGLPIWFLLAPDPLGPFVDAVQPPPPTPVVLDDDVSGSGGAGGGSGSGGGLWPTTGVVTRGFGCQAFYTGIDGAGFGCPDTRPWFHNGVDIANAAGTQVWAASDGTVAFAGPHSTGPDCSAIPGSEAPHRGLGNYQRLEGGGLRHYFGHLRGFLVTGGAVAAGQPVAQMGSTGCSSGPHLHWTLYEHGQLLDPAQWAGPGPSP